VHRIWAVAKNTIRQALRLKIAAAFIILLLILLPIMGVTMTGDGTLKGRLQTFVSYSLSLTSFLLCLLTIIASAYSLASDIKQMQVYTVITKPIRRFQLILGKLLGIVLLNTVLLFIFSAIIYSITLFMPKFFNAAEADVYQVNNEFYTARASIVPQEPDVTKDVNETYNRIKTNLQLPENLTYNEIISQLTRQKKLQMRAAAVGHQLIWEFNNVRPVDPNGSLFIRFKYETSVTPPDSQVFSQWFIGDYRQIKYGLESKVPMYSTPVRKDPIRTFREIEVPANAVAEDGYLAVGFLNVPLNNTVVIFPLEDGLEVLYKADNFSANFLRAVLLLLFRLIFLACLGILASSFLSFPVAILFCLVIFFTATFSSFVMESFDMLGKNLSGVYSYTFRPVILLLPQFDKFNPTKYLVPARLLSWLLVVKAAGLIVCIKSFLLLLLSILIFSFREIAKIII
jgi:hypothetical protein